MDLLIALASLAASSTIQPPLPEPERSRQDIVVTGPEAEEAEAPYSETERVPLGSRIARRERVRPFNTVATEQGVAGLVGASGLGNYDGSGGANLNIRNRHVRNCRAADRQVREDVACVLLRVDRHTRQRQLDAAQAAQAAQAALAPLLSSGQLNGAERYYVGRYAYRVARARQDDAARAQALELLLASDRLVPADRLHAERTLASIRTATP